MDEFFYLGIKQFEEVAKTISHWKEYILNSFILVESIDSSCMRRLSNGPIQGINSILEKLILMVMDIQIFLDLEIERFIVSIKMYHLKIFNFILCLAKKHLSNNKTGAKLI